MCIPPASVNFSIDEKSENVFVIHYHRKTSNAEYEPRLS